MRSLKYLFRKLIQWIAGVFYEGPEPPPRLAKSVDAFAYMNPVATREAWAQWALEFAQASYREGFQRGYEQRVEDLSSLAGTIVLPREDSRVSWETATPYRLEPESKIAESLPLRSRSGKVATISLDDALAPDEELRKEEDQYWLTQAGIGPKR